MGNLPVREKYSSLNSPRKSAKRSVLLSVSESFSVISSQVFRFIFFDFRFFAILPGPPVSDADVGLLSLVSYSGEYSHCPAFFCSRQFRGGHTVILRSEATKNPVLVLKILKPDPSHALRKTLTPGPSLFSTGITTYGIAPDQKAVRGRCRSVSLTGAGALFPVPWPGHLKSLSRHVQPDMPVWPVW